MYERVGLHILGGFRGPIGRPPVVVLVNVDAAYYHQVRAEVGDGCIIAVRWVSWPERSPREWPWLEMAAMAHPRTLFLGDNEPHITTRDMAEWYRDYELDRMARLHEHGLHAAILSPSVGQFEAPIWTLLRPCIDAMQPGDYVAVHEYWGVSPQVSTWHTTRWQHVPELRDVPILVAETGRDYVPDPNLARDLWGAAGWRRGASVERYLWEIGQYDAMLAEWPNVAGAALFTVGNDPRWRDFDVMDIWPTIRDAQGPVHVPPPAKPPAPTLPVPGARVSQAFGVDEAAYGPGGHRGVDLSVPAGTEHMAWHGTPVYATEPGVARVIREGGAYGVYVYTFGARCDELLGHLADAAVADNTPVVPGTMIGWAGYSGTCRPNGVRGCHVHWGKRPRPYRMDNGRRGYVDPMTV